MKVATFDSESFCGYTQISTFFEDLSIADMFGLGAIIDTYTRAFKEWKNDYKMVTELCMVLNWKSWQWSEKNQSYCDFYVEKFYEVRDWCLDNLKGEKLEYFIRTTD